MTENDLRLLAERVRTLAPVQPWGRRGNEPVPVEITWDGERWTVRYVESVNASTHQRRWRIVRSLDLAHALRVAAGDVSLADNLRDSLSDPGKRHTR